jgi:hypothetical protein
MRPIIHVCPLVSSVGIASALSGLFRLVAGDRIAAVTHFA